MELDTAYIAGFFDGEGSVGIYRGTYKGKFVNYRMRTQLVQNKSSLSEKMFECLSKKFGGTYTLAKTTHGYKYNWQLGTNNAVEFLKQIAPYLVLKKEQVDVAIVWQLSRPEVVRWADGVTRYAVLPDEKFDYRVSQLLKFLKKNALEEASEEMKKTYFEVMEQQSMLVETLHHVKPILNVKG